jgi:hypothetical protein
VVPLKNSLFEDEVFLCLFSYDALMAILSEHFFFPLTGFYSPYWTLAFLNGLLDPQTFGRTPWLGDQSNTRPLLKHRTTQKHADTHPCPEQDLNLRSQCSSCHRQYCLRLLSYWDRPFLVLFPDFFCPSVTIPVAPKITHITKYFIFHIHRIYILWFLYFFSPFPVLHFNLMILLWKEKVWEPLACH